MSVEILKNGNLDYLRSHPEDKNLRENLALNGQNPHTIVVSCADSRVPVERILGAKLGDIFVLRVAGNIITTEIAASIEFALASFSCPQLLVLGHSGCGAVKSAMEYNKKALSPPTENLKKLVSKIAQHTEESKTLGQNIMLNTQNAIQELLITSKLTKTKLRESKLAIYGGIYDIASGKLEFFTPNCV